MKIAASQCSDSCLEPRVAGSMEPTSKLQLTLKSHDVRQMRAVLCLGTLFG